MWITPKTNWADTDYFDLDPDYIRIKNNILHLKDMARRLFLPFSITTMDNYSIDQLPYAEFFNNTENAVKDLYQNTFMRSKYYAKTFAANGHIWDWRDLNRIETTLLQLYTDFIVQEKSRPVLAFTLGGENFGYTI